MNLKGSELTMKIKEMTKEYVTFEIESSSRNLKHEVIFNRKTQEWSCTCEDYHYRKRACKHTRQARELLNDLLIELSCSNRAYVGEVLTSEQIAEI